MSAGFPPLPPPDAAALYVGSPQGQSGPMSLDELVRHTPAGRSRPTRRSGTTGGEWMQLPSTRSCATA
jgi:hypothetical protein